MEKGKSRYDGFGKTTHYDSRGRKTGYSQDSGFGKTTHYDANGRKVGHSYDSGFGSKTHYDSKGREVGKTYDSGLGSSKHYDRNGRQVGYSYDSGHSSSHYSGEGGCYIATCVYGTYDCPQLWTLRRFRDEVLSKYKLGRKFIRFYYQTSPSLVERYGNTKLFNVFWKNILDVFVRYLNNNNIDSSKYEDK